jgi:hypothetical protein
MRSTGRRQARRLFALLFAALAWLPAVALAFAQGLALNPNHALAQRFDFGVHAMDLSSVAFVLMEQTSDRRMARLVRQFDTHGLLGASAAAQVLRRASSWNDVPVRLGSKACCC